VAERPTATETITLMVMQGTAGAIRRIHVRRTWIRRALSAAAVLAAVMMGVSVDYVRVRMQLLELDTLRGESAAQRSEIDAYASQVEEIARKLAHVDRLERKLRVITSLDPADPLPLPGIGGTEGEDLRPDGAWLSRAARHKRMLESFGKLSEAAGTQAQTLEQLLAHLEANSAKLLATPSVAPTKGWVTSTFGYRTSPFTGNREFHRGLDIAGRRGTPVVASAAGVVTVAGADGGLGKAVHVRHDYGVVTKYGHLHEVAVKPGERVKRGQKLGSMGSSGRSTGPHLHYQVEVNRKPVNPQDYILE
jgi:murein DD-endopeptidase MepM/ murein hydrolase activator NlpD